MCLKQFFLTFHRARVFLYPPRSGVFRCSIAFKLPAIGLGEKYGTPCGRSFLYESVPGV